MTNGTAPPSRLWRLALAFIPTKEIAVTPILINLNILIWLIMVATGVDPTFPEIDDLIPWGASSNGAIANGEYWRLFACTYLHYGFIHLGVNMLSLNNVGRILERFIGKWRFALLYTFTGIFASAVSAWWHPYSVGIGASGAILGIVGVLTALLTTNLIEKTVRYKMLRSIGFSIGLMVVLGFMVSGLDNAAHFGGLLAGAIGGYLIYPELKAHYYQHKKQYWGLLGALLLITGGTSWLVFKTMPTRMPEEIYNDALRKEVTAESNFEKNNYSSSQAVNKNVIEYYERALNQLDSIGETDLTEEFKVQLADYKTYMHARIKYYQFISEFLDSKDSVYTDSIEKWGKISVDIRPIIIQSDQ